MCTKYIYTYTINIFQGVCTQTVHCFHGDMSCPTNSNVCVLCHVTIPQRATADHELTARPRTGESDTGMLQEDHGSQQHAL